MDGPCRHKQIVISTGAVATAALAAFDHLMRTQAPAEAGLAHA